MLLRRFILVSILVTGRSVCLWRRLGVCSRARALAVIRGRWALATGLGNGGESKSVSQAVVLALWPIVVHSVLMRMWNCGTRGFLLSGWFDGEIYCLLPCRLMWRNATGFTLLFYPFCCWLYIRLFLLLLLMAFGLFCHYTSGVNLDKLQLI